MLNNRNIRSLTFFRFSNNEIISIEFMFSLIKLGIIFKILNVGVFSTIFFFSVSNLESLPVQEVKNINDKLLHITAYFLLSLTTFLAQWNLIENFKKKDRYLKRILSNQYFLVFGFVFIYGMTLEFIQSTLPSRNFDLIDIIANFVGIILSLISIFFIKSLIDRT